MRKLSLSQGKFALVDNEDYDWLIQWNWHTHKGCNTLYAARNRNMKDTLNSYIILMHREIMKTPTGMEVDHRNGNGLDNQKYNMRNCTNAQNSMNMSSRDGSSICKGVSWRKVAKKWQAQINHNYTHINLGLFDSEIEAAKAYDRTAKILFGEFAHLNFPNEKEVLNEQKKV